MKHYINEIYKLNSGKLVTEEYCEVNNIAILTNKECRKLEVKPEVFAKECRSHINNNKPVKVLDVNGDKLIYLFGEKTWFDTAEELAKHREEYQAERKASAEKTKIKKDINEILNTMSIEELTKVLEIISK